MWLLDIVTVTKNDEPGLTATHRSVKTLLEDKSVRWIVVDGSERPSELINRLQSSQETNQIIYTNGPDAGIYDAMNKARRLLEAQFCWHLNSGDVFQNKDLSCGELLKTLRDGIDQKIDGFFFAYEKSGRRQPARGLTYAKYGMPTCHQAIIMKTRFVSEFDQSFPFAADYKWLAELYYRGVSIKVCDPVLCIFDDQGQSSLQQGRYNAEMRQIQRNQQGLLLSNLFFFVRALTRNFRIFSVLLRVRN